MQGAPQTVRIPLHTCPFLTLRWNGPRGMGGPDGITALSLLSAAHSGGTQRLSGYAELLVVNIEFPPYYEVV